MAEVKQEMKIGDEMDDGTILVGYYGGEPLYATPRDAPGTYTFNEAARYAKDIDAHGHRDWRVPTKGELNVLFQNRAAIGKFDESGSGPDGLYWSSSQDDNKAWKQRFSDGYQGNGGKYYCWSLRLVR